MFESIEKLIKNFLEEKEVALKSLKKNTLLKIKTKNSIYEIIYLEENKATIKGGSRFTNPTPIQIIGSGMVSNVILKNNAISYKMRLHFYDEKNKMPIVTSPVFDITIIAPDNSWEYSLNWDKDQYSQDK